MRDWEPRAALVGVGATEAVARGALRRPRATAARSCSRSRDGDAARVAALLGELGYVDVTTTTDLAGRDRVVEGVHAT